MSALQQDKESFQFGRLPLCPSQAASTSHLAGAGGGTETGIAAYEPSTQAAAPAGVLDTVVETNQDLPQLPDLPFTELITQDTTTNGLLLSDDELSSYSPPPAKPINAPNSEWSNDYVRTPKDFPDPCRLRDTDAFNARKHMKHLLIPDEAHLPIYLTETQRRSSMTTSEIAADRFDLADQRKRKIQTKEGYLKERIEKGRDVAAREAVEAKKDVVDRRAKKRKARYVAVEKKEKKDTTQYTLYGLQYGKMEDFGYGTQNVAPGADVKPKSDRVFTGPIYDEDDWGYFGYK